jgi:hypothetical protein
LSLGLRGERLVEALGTLAEEAKRAGRDPDTIGVTLSGVSTSATVDLTALEEAGALGARRIVINLMSADLGDALEELGQMAVRAQLAPRR